MTTIDEIRDITFYLLRKLNDFLVDLTTEIAQPQPIPQYREMTEEDEDTRRRIQEIRTRLNTPPPPPTPITTEEIVDEEGDNISRQIEEIQTSLEEEKKEFIEDLQKRIKEKEIILNYLISKLVNLRESEADIVIINHVSDEFHSLKEERDKLEERINNIRN